MKRQRGRGRKPGGGGGGGGGGHNANRSFESTGPDMKVRGSASHIHEKYLQLARDATSSGDRVLAESYLQHAEHYYRVMRAMQPAYVPQTMEQRFGPDLDEEEDRAQGGESEGEVEDDLDAPREQRQDRGERQDRGDRPDRDRHERRPDRPRFERGDRGERRDRPERERDRERERPEPRDVPERTEAPVVRAEGEEEGDGEFRRRRPRRSRFRSDAAAPEGGERPAREQSGDGISEGFGDGPRPAFLAGE